MGTVPMHKPDANNSTTKPGSGVATTDGGAWFAESIEEVVTLLMGDAGKVFDPAAPDDAAMNRVVTELLCATVGLRSMLMCLNHGKRLDDPTWSCAQHIEVVTDAVAAVDAARLSRAVAGAWRLPGPDGRIDADAREVAADVARRVETLAQVARVTAALDRFGVGPQRNIVNNVGFLAASAWARARVLNPELAATHPFVSGGRVETAIHGAASEELAREIDGYMARAHGALTPATEASILRVARHCAAYAEGFVAACRAERRASGRAEERRLSAIKKLTSAALDYERAEGRDEARPAALFLLALPSVGVHARVYDVDPSGFPWCASMLASFLANVDPSNDGSVDLAHKAVKALGHTLKGINGPEASKRWREKNKRREAERERSKNRRATARATGRK